MVEIYALDLWIGPILSLQSTMDQKLAVNLVLKELCHWVGSIKQLFLVSFVFNILTFSLFTQVP